MAMVFYHSSGFDNDGNFFARDRRVGGQDVVFLRSSG